MTASTTRRPYAPLLCLIRLLTALALVTAVGCTSSSSSDESSASGKHKHRFSIFSYNIRSDGKQCKAEWSKAPPLPPSLWQRVERRYELPNSTSNERIITERNWYTKHPLYLDRMSARSSRYLYYVAGQLEARKLPGELALLPIVESAYNPFAISTSQASGLWQFIPSTAKHLKMEMNWWYDSRRDVPASTDSALNYLVFLRDHYDGDWLKALAAYNAGWGTIDKAVAKNKARGLPTDYWNLDVPAETAAYVPKLLALAQISKTPATYGVNWAYIPDLPYFAEVRFQGQLDVAFAADLAGVDSDELHMLNPGISRWATPPGGPYRLLVPIDQANDLQERIAGMNAAQKMPTPIGNYEQTANPRMQEMEEKASRNTKASSSRTSASDSSRSASSSAARSYTVKKGDTMWSIAKKAGMSADALRKLNHLDNSEPLKLGQKIALSGSASSSSTNSSNTTSSSKTTTSSSKKTDSSAGKRVSQTFTPGTQASANSTASSKKGQTTYKVKSGDTLMGISRKYNVSVNDIARWNSLGKNQTALKPGQSLTLHLDAGKN